MLIENHCEKLGQILQRNVKRQVQLNLEKLSESRKKMGKMHGIIEEIKIYFKSNKRALNICKLIYEQLIKLE